MAQDIIELSQIAHEYHQEFGYQDYITWVKEELKLGTTQGKRFLQVYDKFGTNLVLTDIAPSALYLLSAPSTPDSAREEALELAESGETVIVIESIFNNIVLHIVNFDSSLQLPPLSTHSSTIAREIKTLPPTFFTGSLWRLKYSLAV